MQTAEPTVSPYAYDVIISGGGLAGLSLARQLTLTIPAINILVLEKNRFPVREAAYKVGESTVEIAGYYFREVLQLSGYLKNDQYVKAGLRYFFREEGKQFGEFAEVGLSKFSPVDSYQIDRGKFENDLAWLNRVNGVRIVDGVSVTDIQLREGAGHEVVYLDAGGEEVHVTCRWAIDATGRRSLLQKKLGFRKQVDSKCSAVWFRVKGRFDVSDLVSADDREWHQRVPHRIRYYSTTHLMGPGFWIWIIPLTNNNTSIGVVIDEKVQSYSDLNTLSKAEAWIRHRYPEVADHMRSFEVMDFLGLRHYSYSSRKIMSEHRWACTGEAAVFPDPFYSPGSNLIGLTNMAITRLIEDDLSLGVVDRERVQFYDQFIISQNEWLIADIQSSYPYFGNPQVESLSYLWDIVVGWTIAAPQMFNAIFLDDKKFIRVREVINSFSVLSLRIRKLFVEWSGRSRGSFSFRFIDYLAVPFIKTLYDRVLRPGKTADELVSDYREAMRYIEDFAQVLFRMILEDCMPETLSLLPDPYWINVWGVSLDPGRWAEDRLFSPRTEVRGLKEVDDQLRELYRFDTQTGKDQEQPVDRQVQFI
ncbi:MAG TPA: tryptophan 7-halogenase [Puia sp.]|uniref:NAD(P)/FAD-dependent oxidoreductase n=1 Tax=Puia sp. TaxID=2045100 RepID=UPI002B81CF7B|nr:tryptophan 7-halogenase [Puia sp.]HVU95546.1 tryptophan 7-halogenase [Puia sp.]